MMRDDLQVQRTDEQSTRGGRYDSDDVTRRRIVQSVRRIRKLDPDAGDFLATLLALLAHAGESGDPILEVMQELHWFLIEGCVRANSAGS